MGTLCEVLKNIILSATLVITGAAQAANTYDDRPDVLSKNVPAEKRDIDIATWKKFKDGALNYNAFLLATYPDSDIYFLARDGEYLYDTARLLTEKNPELAARIKLIPINSTLREQPKVYKPYLSQIGFDELWKDKKRSVVFVDTCCSGSIPHRIKAAYAAAQKKHGRKIYWHFLKGGNPTPSSRVFVEKHDGYQAIIENFGKLRIGGAIEGYPHYTQSVDTIVPNKKGELVALVGDNDEKEKNQALALMSDLKHDFGNENARAEFLEKVAHLSEVRKFALDDPTRDPAKIQAAFDYMEQNDLKSYGLDLAEIRSFKQYPGILKKERIELIKNLKLKTGKGKKVAKALPAPIAAERTKKSNKCKMLFEAP